MSSNFLDFLEPKTILDASPSFHIRAFFGGETLVDTKLGEAFRFYDIASLTKIVYTTTRFMELVSSNDFSLDTNITQFLGKGFQGEGTVRDLLTHSLGHRWWAPLYTQLTDGVDEPYQVTKQWGRLADLLATEAKEPTGKFVYSDIDFMFLGLILEKSLGLSIHEDFDKFRLRWGLENSFYSVDNLCPVELSEVAPTELSKVWKKRMHGQVHDENTYALGGVSSHAGLFSPMDDLGNWAMNLRSSFLSGSDTVSKATAKEFMTRQCLPDKGDWSLGFMMPTIPTASCGPDFSPNSIGHTGFTGTSFWYDMDKDLMVLILSNRVFSGRENKKFVSLRPQLHSAVVRFLEENYEY